VTVGFASAKLRPDIGDDVPTTPTPAETVLETLSAHGIRASSRERRRLRRRAQARRAALTLAVGLAASVVALSVVGRGSSVGIPGVFASDQTPHSRLGRSNLSSAQGTRSSSGRTSSKSSRCGGVSGLYVPSCGAWFGTTGAPDLAAAERFAGRRADIFHEYETFASYSGARPFPGAAAEAAIDTHHMFFFSWKPILADGTIVPWARIADGQMDAEYVDVLARKIRKWSAQHHGEKVFMAFHHEPENDIGKFGTASDYARAWRHIDARFVALHARRAVIFVWDMAGYETRVGEWNALYPGDRVVDWLAWDPYGKTQYSPPSAPILPFTTAVGQYRGGEADDTGAYRFYKWATGTGAEDPRSGRVFAKVGSHGKPLMIAEFGVCSSAATLASAELWYEQAATAIQGGAYPLVKAFVSFDFYDCFQPTESPQMEARFGAAVGVPRLRQPTPY
jgi:hypothetical protein